MGRWIVFCVRGDRVFAENIVKCDHEHCKREATHAPKILVPAMGWPQEEKHALTLICGLKLCREHAADFDPDDIPDLPKFMEIAGRASGSPIPPDVGRAWVKAIPIDGDEYRTFERIKNERPGEGGEGGKGKVGSGVHRGPG